MNQKNKNYFALIMAGGQGKRFWPYSTEKKPKQFLNIIGEGTLINQTYSRLDRFIKRDNIYIVADRKYLDLIQQNIPDFSPKNFISEPMPKNTAPCLILANIVLEKKNSNANLLVVPADHYITEEDIFAGQLITGLKYGDNKCIITSGIKPTSPHTGYGYINFNNDLNEELDKELFYSVRSFTEKPDLQTAHQYYTDGNYFWNSGIFIYKVKYFKEFLKEYSPYYFQQYQALERAYGSENFANIFSEIKPESIDYALMEKVKEVKMFKATYSWSDVGAWSSVYDLGDKDKSGNVAKADKSILIDTRNSLIFSNELDKPISLIGMKDVAVINTKDGIVISKISELQKIKDILEKL